MGRILYIIYATFLVLAVSSSGVGRGGSSSGWSGGSSGSSGWSSGGSSHK